MNEFFTDWKSWGFRVALWNLRFTVGYRIGGFTSARRRDDTWKKGCLSGRST